MHISVDSLGKGELQMSSYILCILGFQMAKDSFDRTLESLPWHLTDVRIRLHVLCDLCFKQMSCINIPCVATMFHVIAQNNTVL